MLILGLEPKIEKNFEFSIDANFLGSLILLAQTVHLEFRFTNLDWYEKVGLADTRQFILNSNR